MDIDDELVKLIELNDEMNAAASGSPFYNAKDAYWKQFYAIVNEFTLLKKYAQQQADELGRIKHEKNMRE